jgi:predicted NUDIX family NTP pyrophosphohydrolase
MYMGKPVKKSAGILLYRLLKNKPEFFLVHPGGPFWTNKDAGAWTIPKGEYDINEEPLAAAIREFSEETGHIISGNFISLTPIIQKAGKQVDAWALEGDIDTTNIRSNSFNIEWPPKSGNWKSYPEIDRAEWFDIKTAKEKINPAQVAFLEELIIKLDGPGEQLA